MATRCVSKQVVRNRRIVVFQRSAVRHFIVIADIVGRHAARDFFHTISIPVANIRRRVRTDGNVRQFVFLVIDQRVANCQAK